MRGIGQDVVFAMRMLARKPLAMVVAIVCLACGIGATTTMFSVGSTLLTQPMPFPNGDRLVQVFSQNNSSFPQPPNSYQDMLDWRRRTHSFTAMGGIGQWDYIVRLAGEPLRVRGGLATSGFFETLGAQPESGRFFTEDEDQPGSARVAIVSHSLAQRVLGSAQGAVGRVITVTGQPVTIVGVLPDRWAFPSSAQIWVPVAHANGRTRRGSRNMMVVASLKAGVTIDEAGRDLAAIGAQLAAEYPETNAGIRPSVAPLRERYVGGSRAPLRVLTVAALLILLVACANAAGLQLARATQRRRELAMRAALGAGRARLSRQLLTESVLLSLVAAASGIALATWGTHVVSRAVAAGAPPWLQFGLDGRALVFTVMIAVAVGVVSGVVPALRLSAIDPADTLRGGRDTGVGRAQLQRVFVGAEVALSLILLVGAGLALLGVHRLRTVTLGFDPERVVTLRVLLEGPRYDTSSNRVAAVNELVRVVGAVPGVAMVAATGMVPVVDCCSRYGLTVEGQPVEPGHEPLINGNTVTPGFFRTMRIPLISGRDFSPGEGSDSAPVVIVSQSMARTYWPGVDPIGRRIKTGDDQWAPVIGVVGDTRQNNLGDAPEPQLYFPYPQQRWSGMTLVVRSRTADPSPLLPSIRRAVFAMDPNIPVSGEETLTAGIAEQVASPETVSSFIAGFAALALLLAAAGIYAIMAFYVSQRTRELGVRLALGAEPGALLRMVLWQGTTVALAGAAVGLGGSLAIARLLAGAFYGVGAFEPMLYVGPAVLLVGIAIGASGVPALRASRVDPMDALRSD